MSAQLGVCLLLGLAASAEDLWRRRISNVTVLAGLLAGVACQIAARGWRHGPSAWMGGAALGFAVFLVFFLLGGMGGGDIKLMAAFGGCLGAGQILRAALLTAIVGALVACGYLFWKWMRRRWTSAARGAALPAAAPGQESIPYAPAIFIGALLSFL
ncbi:MAG TPA: prepilin peptidase [Bryobacterales bacterium]|nr:prepilin peptidase [Bryobacterales bacterium]